MKKPKFKIGDRVKSHSSIVAKGTIEFITEGGKKVGMPWDDDTPHYGLTDEKTGILTIFHEKSLEKT